MLRTPELRAFLGLEAIDLNWRGAPFRLEFPGASLEAEIEGVEPARGNVAHPVCGTL